MRRVFFHGGYRKLAGMLLVTAAYIVTGVFGLALASVHTSATPVWAPTGIAIAGFLLLGNGVWPAVFLAAFTVNVLTSGSPVSSLFIATGNMLEGLTAAVLVRRFADWPYTFEHVHSTLRFVLMAVLAAPVASATVGVTVLAVLGEAAWSDYPAIWLTWWVGDAVGAIVVAPLLLLLFEGGIRIAWRSLLKPQSLGLVLLTALFFTVAFSSGLLGGPFRNLPVSFLAIPPVILVAMGYGRRATVAMTFILSTISIVATLRGMGPFGVLPNELSLLLLQAFIGVVSFSGLLLAVALREKFHEEEYRYRFQERFQGIFRSSRDGIAYKSLDGTFVDVNPAFTQLMGYSRAELLRGMTYEDLTPPEHRGTEGEKLREVLATGRSLEFEKEYIHKDGHRVPVLLTMFLVRERRGVPIGVAVIIKDITQRKYEEHARSRFVTLASHQLRTPLAGLRWAMSSLQEHIGDRLQPVDRDTLDAAMLSARTMADVMETLLYVAEMETGALHPKSADIRVRDFLTECAEEFRSISVGSPREVRIDCPEDLRVQSDPRLLRQILSILLDNAAKFSPEHAGIRLRGEDHGGSIRITVADRGMGITPEDRGRIFQMFFRGREAVDQGIEGHGLGLYSARLMCEMLGGTIAFASVPEGGTEFSLALPASAGESASGTTDIRERRPHTFPVVL